MPAPAAGAMSVLGRAIWMGWKDNNRAIANSKATLVNSDGCKLKPPGRAIQRSTELALKMMMYNKGKRETIQAG